MTTFRVPTGTKCHVRRKGDSAWKPHRTTRDLEFDTHAVADNGGTWVFASNDWQIKVATRFVAGRDPAPERGCFGTSKGRGSSRRRNMRAAKRDR